MWRTWCRAAARLLHLENLMPSTDKVSVQELRSESERSRNALASTVDEVRDTVRNNTGRELKTLVSPAHRKKEIRNYVREERESAIQRRARDNPARSRDALTNFVKDYPLLVAGLGAAVGAFIAASIPWSEAENKLFGAGSEKLKNKACEAAAQGIEQAGNIAAEAAGSAAADHGLETALGGNSQSGQQSNGQQPSTQRNAT